MKLLMKLAWRLTAFLGLLVAYSSSCSHGTDIRLAQIPTLSSPDGNVGRLEVCNNGVWGTITLQQRDNFWSEKNVQVACIQLQFSGGINSIPPINIPEAAKAQGSLLVHFSMVSCYGNETNLSQCKKRMTNTLLHDRDVFIVCRPKRMRYSGVHVAGEQIGDFRLFGSVKNGEGAVEVLTSLGWSGICPDSSWTSSAARVFCRALGYDLGETRVFMDDNYSIYLSLSDAQCSQQPLLDNSSPSRVYTKHCSFSMDDCPELNNSLAGISCGSLRSSFANTVRLFGVGLFSKERVLGVVEVFQDNKWGMVCSNQSRTGADVNARVICRFLYNRLYPNAKSTVIPLSSLALYESNLKPMWVDDIMCPQNATLVSQCQFKEPLGFSNCSSRHILAVDCDSIPQGSEGNTSSIIIGSVVVTFVFMVILLIFLKVLYTTLRRRRCAAPVTSFALSATYPGNLDETGLNSGLNGADLHQETGVDDDLKFDGDNIKPDNPEGSRKQYNGAATNDYINCRPSA